MQDNNDGNGSLPPWLLSAPESSLLAVAAAAGQQGQQTNSSSILLAAAVNKIRSQQIVEGIFAGSNNNRGNFSSAIEQLNPFLISYSNPDFHQSPAGLLAARVAQEQDSNALLLGLARRASNYRVQDLTVDPTALRINDQNLSGIQLGESSYLYQNTATLLAAQQEMENHRTTVPPNILNSFSPPSTDVVHALPLVRTPTEIISSSLSRSSNISAMIRYRLHQEQHIGRPPSLPGSLTHSVLERSTDTPAGSSLTIAVGSASDATPFHATGKKYLQEGSLKRTRKETGGNSSSREGDKVAVTSLPSSSSSEKTVQNDKQPARVGDVLKALGYAETEDILESLGLSCLERRMNKNPYVDASSFQDPTPDVIASFRRASGGVNEPFPEKLYRMIQEATSDGNESIMSFFPHGRAFGIHKPAEFVAKIMPKYFKSTRMSSFQRQLNLYGFGRINAGPDVGGYYHELFLRGRPALCIHISRVGVPQEGSHRKRGVKSHQATLDPYFYEMAPIRGVGRVDSTDG